MAVYTLKEFADLCGISKAAMSMAKSRKKINVTQGENQQDQRVDSSDPLNAAFLERSRAKGAAGSGSPAQPGGRSKSKKSKEKPAEPEKPGPLLQLELDKKAVDLAKAQQDREVNDIKLKKMRGELVPTELAKATIKHLFTSFSTSFKQAVDSLMIEIAHKTHINNNQQAELRGALTRILNTAINKGVDDAKVLVDRIVDEFREDK